MTQMSYNTVRIFRLLAAGLVPFALAGCTDANTPAWLTPGTATAPATTQPGQNNEISRAISGTGGPQIVYQIRFDVVRASVPMGEISGSGKIWNYVNEDIVQAEWAANLRRNGLRVGLGSSSAWPPIRANLEAIRNMRSTAMTPFIVKGGAPLTVEVDRTPRDQVLFIYRPDSGKPVGADFRNSVNAFRIEYAIPPTELDSVALRFVPEIRLRYPTTEQQFTLNGFQPAPSEGLRAITELAFDAVVPPDHFILIGPSPAVKTELLAGRALLTVMIDGQPYESLFFITPKVIKVTQGEEPQ